MDTASATRLKTRVTVVAAVSNIFLSGGKIGVGIVWQSGALLADGIHSLADLISDIITLVAVKLGSREADHNHPYGHRRFETLATILLGLGLLVVAGGIITDAVLRLLSPEQLLHPSSEALVAAGVSIVANEALFQYTRRVAKTTRSKLLLANAWHHRSDAFSSVVVLLGVGAVLMGYPFADAVAAGVVALMIGKIGSSLLLESIAELVDSALPDAYISQIRKVIKLTPGVQSIHLLRTRKMGEDAYIDAHIVVAPHISVSEGHLIGDRVRDNLKSEFVDLIDVLVHIDPEDDEFKDDNTKVWNRQQVANCLGKYLVPTLDEVSQFNIHYLDNLIEVEVILPYATASQAELLTQLKSQCRLLEQEVPMICKVTIFFKL